MEELCLLSLREAEDQTWEQPFVFEVSLETVGNIWEIGAWCGVVLAALSSTVHGQPRPVNFQLCSPSTACVPAHTSMLMGSQIPSTVRRKKGF